MPTLALAGRFEKTTGLGVLVRSTFRTEGPRTGGHNFAVAETRIDSVTFVPQFETAPGNQIQYALFGHGSVTLTFRDNGVSGLAFTTCTFTENLSGAKPPT